jgi:hypothetical protein
MARKKKTEKAQLTEQPVSCEQVNKNLVELSDYERELIIKSFELAAKHIPPCYYKDIDNIVAKFRM